MIEHVDYKFVEKATSDFYSVKLLTGKFAGVIYTYGLVKLQENLESDSLTVQFDYKIEDTPLHCQPAMGDLNTNVEFKDYIGDMLGHILSKKDGKIGPFGNNDGENVNTVNSGNSNDTATTDGRYYYNSNSMQPGPDNTTERGPA
jgi:hypothetical protein